MSRFGFGAASILRVGALAPACSEHPALMAPTVAPVAPAAKQSMWWSNAADRWTGSRGTTVSQMRDALAGFVDRPDVRRRAQCAPLGAAATTTAWTEGSAVVPPRPNTMSASVSPVRQSLESLAGEAETAIDGIDACR